MEEDKPNNSRWMVAQSNMEGANGLESANIASQQTHCEQTNVAHADVVTDVTLTSKRLDQTN